MTQEEKAKRYDEALEIAKKNHVTAQDLCEGSQIGVECFKNTLESIFPELKESENERIRKELTEFLKKASGGFLDSTIQCKTFGKWRTWLENQGKQKTIEKVNGEDYGIDGLWHAQIILEKTLGSVSGYQSDDGILDHKAAITAVKKLYEQKPIDKIEPKFNEGDWITNANGNYTWQVISVDYLDYTLQNQCGECVEDTVDYVNKAFHLWTIQDAKDGDVIWHVDSASNGIFIFREIRHDGKVLCYCDYDSEDHFCTGEYHTCCWSQDKYIKPATKEQCNLLFQKMKEAGYEWDADKKELNKEE